MRKKYGILLFLLLMLFLTGCQQEQKSITVKINGLIIEGNHEKDKNDDLFLETEENEWLSSQFPNKKTISIEELKKEYKVIKDKWSKDVYQLVLLPEGFHYVTPEEDGKQTWVQSELYPKGIIVNINDFTFDNIVMEITPSEDYSKGVDEHGFDYGWFETVLLDGLPIPSPKNIQIVDFPNGHQDMDKIKHYSVMIGF